MRRGWIFLAGAAIILFVLVLAGAVGWRQHALRKSEERQFVAASQAVAAGRGLDALAIVRSRIVSSKPAPAREREWHAIEVHALAQLREVPRLLHWFDREPSLILEDEAASLLVARGALAAGNRPAFDQVRNSWRGREKQDWLWFALDADTLLASGKRPAALALLQSRTFPGERDCARLLRLALLNAAQPARAAEYLDQAFRADPRNPDARSFRAQVMEASGRLAEARVEYVAALVATPSNPLLRDQLAEFYRRNGNLDLALRTWAEGLTPGTPDFLWTKFLFWSRVFRPVNGPVRTGTAAGPLASFVVYLGGLPPGRFWDDALFDAKVESRQVIRDREEAYWLRLLQMIHDGNEKEALEWMKLRRSRGRSWNPGLERALYQILCFRRKPALSLAGEGELATAPPVRGRHAFFEQLDKAWNSAHEARVAPLLSPELRGAVSGTTVFSAACMAGGWIEAALALWPDNSADAPSPDWVAFGMAQCLRENRGRPAALAFLAKQPSVPVLQLLEGELLLVEGRTDEGITKLRPLAAQPSDAGYRAAWLLAALAMDKGNPVAAREWVRGHPTLAASVTGREILARAALAEGDEAGALRAYNSLRRESVEARMFLARRAFAAKDWKEARLLTTELLREMPDELILRANLEAIRAAEGTR
jgi:predicted Zn-dependent protease